jgi:hypothetical protein
MSKSSGAGSIHAEKSGLKPVHRSKTKGSVFMRAEIESVAQEIKQSLELLRRHL